VTFALFAYNQEKYIREEVEGAFSQTYQPLEIIWSDDCSSDRTFAPAAELLQWQTVGNVFKLASWALAFSIVAAAWSKTFLLMELSFNIVFLAMVWFLLPVMELSVTGIVFLVGYIVNFVTVNIVAHTLQGFRWQALLLWLLALNVTLSVALLAFAQMLPLPPPSPHRSLPAPPGCSVCAWSSSRWV